MPDYQAIDIHIHIQPLEMLNAQAAKAFGAHHADWQDVREIVASPTRFLKYLDSIGVE